MAKIYIDDSKFPFVFVDYPERISEQEFDDFIVALDRTYARGQLAVIVDLSKFSASLKERSYIAQKIDHTTLRHPNTVVAEALYIESALQRRMVTAYNWLKGDKSYPTRTFSDPTQAYQWAKDELKKHELI